MNYHVTSTY